MVRHLLNFNLLNAKLLTGLWLLEVFSGPKKCPRPDMNQITFYLNPTCKNLSFLKERPDPKQTQENLTQVQPYPLALFLPDWTQM